ncbi:MAG TPA: response regulator transcription factor [Acidobacteriota bacterium]|nr:response regulator transcription factor [Acidobacteriota bacterium]
MTVSDSKSERDGAGVKPVRILLADDHSILRSGLRGLLEKEPLFKVIAEAEDGRAAVQLYQKLTPDVVLMDISMHDLNGIEATRQITGSDSKAKIIILSIHSGQKFVAEVLKAGASGYLLKGCEFTDVICAIRTVLTGETYLCPQIATVLRNDYLQRISRSDLPPASVLTPREREVLQLMAEGKSTKEIAYSFNLSVKTVEVHRQKIMEKLNIHSIAELTKYAIREGLTSLEG